MRSGPESQEVCEIYNLDPAVSKVCFYQNFANLVK